VEGVEQLLAGGGAGKRRSLVQRSAETATIDEAFGRAVKGYAEPIHQVDNFRRPVGHFLHGRLMLEEVAAIDGIIEMLPLAVAQLPRLVVDAVDATLSTHAVG